MNIEKNGSISATNRENDEANDENDEQYAVEYFRDQQNYEQGQLLTEEVENAVNLGIIDEQEDDSDEMGND